MTFRVKLSPIKPLHQIKHVSVQAEISHNKVDFMFKRMCRGFYNIKSALYLLSRTTFARKISKAQEL
jgi:hypothetical protein